MRLSSFTCCLLKYEIITNNFETGKCSNNLVLLKLLVQVTIITNRNLYLSTYSKMNISKGFGGRTCYNNNNEIIYVKKNSEFICTYYVPTWFYYWKLVAELHRSLWLCTALCYMDETMACHIFFIEWNYS